MRGPPVDEARGVEGPEAGDLLEGPEEAPVGPGGPLSLARQPELVLSVTCRRQQVSTAGTRAPGNDRCGIHSSLLSVLTTLVVDDSWVVKNKKIGSDGLRNVNAASMIQNNRSLAWFVIYNNTN